MLTMPIDKITVLLDLASGVGIAPEEDMAEGADGAATGEADEDVAAYDVSAYRDLAAMLGQLTPGEIRELLTIASVGDGDDTDGPWEAQAQRTDGIDTVDAVEVLMRVLVLTNAVEDGLDRLGYAVVRGDEAEPGEGEDEGDNLAEDGESGDEAVQGDDEGEQGDEEEANART